MSEHAARARVSVACVVAVVSLGCSVPVAQAGQQWLSAADLASATAAQAPDVAMNHNGDSGAAWVSPGGVVQAATRPAGGSFTAAADLSAAGAVTPHVAIDAAGTVVVVWQSASTIIQAAVRLAGGSFGSTQDLSLGGENAREPQVAMDPSGNAVVVWKVGPTDATQIVQASVRPAGGSFTGPFGLVSGSEGALAPQVAMDPAGNAVVVWTTLGNRVRASMRRAGGSFAGAPFTPAATVDQQALLASDVQVAMSANGHALAVWKRNIGTSNAVIHSATSGGGAPFPPNSPTTVSPTGQDLSAPQLGMDDAGNAIVVWQRLNSPSNYSVQPAYRPAGGAFNVLADLAGGIPQAPKPQIAVSPAGPAIAVWQGTTGANTIAQASVRLPGGEFSGATNISVAGLDAKSPQAAIDRDGDGIAAWLRNGAVQTAGYDAAGPQLRGLSVPATGVAGTTTSWSVSPLDVWSGVVSTVWDFGDASSAVGASATHVFGAAGTYAVTVTSTDGLGNSSSATRLIDIAPAPLPPPPPPPPPTDADGDGFPEQVDCNDRNAAIHAGADDKPGNKIDENCDGKDAAFPLLGTTINLVTQRTRGSRNLLLSQLTIRPAPAGSTIRLSCSGGRGCRAFKTITRSITRQAGVRDFSKLLPKRKLLPGAKFEVRVTKPATTGRVFRLAIFKGKAASRTNLCLTPGETKPALCKV